MSDMSDIEYAIATIADQEPLNDNGQFRACIYCHVNSHTTEHRSDCAWKILAKHAKNCGVLSKLQLEKKHARQFLEDAEKAAAEKEERAEFARLKRKFEPVSGQ